MDEKDFMNDDNQNLINGAIRILSLEAEIKLLKEDIKAVKQEIKEEGVKVSDLSKAITIIKNEIKRRNKPELKDIELLADELAKNEEVMTLAERIVEN